MASEGFRVRHRLFNVLKRKAERITNLNLERDTFSNSQTEEEVPDSVLVRAATSKRYYLSQSHVSDFLYSSALGC